MKIEAIEPSLIKIPYPEPFEPTWYPGEKYEHQECLLVRVFTDNGLEGIASAEAPFGLAPLFKEALNRLIEPALVGEDPFNVEKIVWKLKDIARVFSRPWVVENAIWDIIGKYCNKPVHKLLGGGRDKVLAYAAWGSLKTKQEAVQDAQNLIEEGFKALKIRLAHPTQEEDIAYVKKIKRAVGGHLDLMVDANQGTAKERNRGNGETAVWSFKRAYETAKALEELDVRWLEEPLYRYDYHNLAKLSSEVSVPIAGGEINRGTHEFAQLIEKDCYDVLQPNCTISTGMSQVKKIDTLAEARGKPCVLHSWIPGSGLAASLQLAATLNDPFYFEYPYDPPSLVPKVFQGVLKDPLTVDEEGYIQVPNDPGLGVSLNEDVVKDYTVDF